MQLSGRLQVLRIRLLAGAALAVLAPAGMVAAQTQPPVQQAGPDALSPDAVYVEADAAVRQGDTITATASDSERALVRARGYTLRGENLSYDLAQGAATATTKATSASTIGKAAATFCPTARSTCRAPGAPASRWSGLRTRRCSTATTSATLIRTTAFTTAIAVG